LILIEVAIALRVLSGCAPLPYSYLVLDQDKSFLSISYTSCIQDHKAGLVTLTISRNWVLPYPKNSGNHSHNAIGVHSMLRLEKLQKDSVINDILTYSLTKSMDKIWYSSVNRANPSTD